MIYRNFIGSRKAALVFVAFSIASTNSQAMAPVANEPAAASSATAAPVAEETFGFDLGRAVVDRNGGASSTYTVAATQDFRSKSTGGKMRLSVVEKDAAGTTTHLLTINTGKYKTVAQLTASLAEIFRRYLATPAANQEVGKIGDLGHGGEIHFVAESTDVLRYDWMTPGEPAHSTRFKRSDIQVFLGILTHPQVGG